MRSQKEKMLAGDLYIANDPELAKESHHGKRLTRLFNNTTEEDGEVRTSILKELFAKTGKNIYIEPPFHTDYGTNTTIGENFYANYECIFLDIAPISIGDNVMLAPRVGLYTAAHPIVSDIRNELFEYGKPIVIGDNVWIGAGAIINPGITIGSNVVIGVQVQWLQKIFLIMLWLLVILAKYYVKLMRLIVSIGNMKRRDILRIDRINIEKCE